MRFSECLSKKRKERGLSQQEFAKSLHISREAVSRWENNKTHPDLKTLAKIFSLFQCPPEEIAYVIQSHSEEL